MLSQKSENLGEESKHSKVSKQKESLQWEVYNLSYGRFKIGLVLQFYGWRLDAGRVSYPTCI